MIIAIDFDGTCVTHEYPFIGKDINAARVLKELTDAGNKLILLTMRNDEIKGTCLKDAINWFKIRNIPLWGINENPDQTWSKSRKVYAQLYIDDANAGCPLTFNKDVCDRPYVNWRAMRNILVDMNLLNN